MRHSLPPRSLAAFAVAVSLLLLSPGSPGLAAEDADVTALTAVDDARVAAMLSADGEALETLLSDELHYAHSNGTVDTKKFFIEVLRSGKTRYLGYEHLERHFTFPAPGLALMTGRARVQAETPDTAVDAVLSYLAVWREEGGRWRFLAWQSCRVPVEAE